MANPFPLVVYCTIYYMILYKYVYVPLNQSYYSYLFECSFEPKTSAELNIQETSTIVSANWTSTQDNSMKTIPIEEYRRLVQASVQLCKANETIDKLNVLLQKKDKMIENLKAKLMTHTEAPHLSPVSER